MGVRIFLGKFSAVFGMRGVLIAGLCVTLLGCIGLGVVSDFWLLATLVGITGLAMGIGQPLTMAWVSRIAPRDSMGMAISVRLTSNRLGQVVVPALAGLIAAGTLSGVFFLMAGLMGVAAVVTSRALPKTD
jgi:MFS family permease